MTTDADRREELRREHAALLLALGMDDPGRRREAEARLAGRGSAYVLAVWMRVAELLDEQLGCTRAEADAELQHRLGVFVGRFGDMLDAVTDGLDDDGRDPPDDLDQALAALLDEGSDQ